MPNFSLYANFSPGHMKKRSIVFEHDANVKIIVKGYVFL